jgi:adenylate kinase
MTAKPKYIILLGPPAAGKGTQATKLCEISGLPHVASGDLFRYNLKNATELGLKAKGYMDRGELVPDDITIAMVLDRLAQPIARAGRSWMASRARSPRPKRWTRRWPKRRGDQPVLNIQVPEEILVERVSGRRLCRTCGEPYHILYKKPQSKGSATRTAVSCTSATMTRRRREEPPEGLLGADQPARGLLSPAGDPAGHRWQSGHR